MFQFDFVDDLKCEIELSAQEVGGSRLKQKYIFLYPCDLKTDVRWGWSLDRWGRLEESESVCLRAVSGRSWWKLKSGNEEKCLRACNIFNSCSN